LPGSMLRGAKALGSGFGTAIVLSVQGCRLQM
jgi:hypothetical protein